MQKADLDFANLPFGFIETDANIRYYFQDGKWSEGELTNSTALELHVASQCLHYGQLCFEGLKVYERPDGKAQTFRVEDNARRMVDSAERFLMEPPPAEMFKEAVFRVVNANRRFIPPHGSGATLYVRPFLIGSGVQLGVNPAGEYQFIVFVSPVGPYYKGGSLSTVHLVVEEKIKRAAPGGVGDVKVAGNYAAGLRATIGAKKQGYNEALYLDAEENKYIDESGSSNFMGVTADNRYVTPKSDSILPSITNKSLMRIAEDEGMTVEPRRVPVEELRDFVEAGCIGTAAVLSPVGSVTYRGERIAYGDGDTAGPAVKNLYKKLVDIQLGVAEDPYGWTEIVPEDG